MTTTKTAAVDWPTLLKMLAGGAGAGAGVGAVTTYLRHLNTLKDRAAMQGDTSGDDDVLYLNLPNRNPVNKKRAAANSTATFALGGASGLLGLYLGYNLIRNLYHKKRKAELQRELDSAQNIYVDRLGKSALAKSASQFSMPTKMVGGAGLGALLMLLGSAAVTNRILQKQFPPIKDPSQERLRKIVIRSRGQEDENKPLSSGDADEVEQLAHNHLENKKASEESGFADLVAAISQGRTDEILHNLKMYGVNVMLDGVKGARFEKTAAVNNNLAVTWMSREPALSEAVAPLLASEFYDAAPWACKLAWHMPEPCLESLRGMAKCAAWRRREKLCTQLGWQRETGPEEKSAKESVISQTPLKDLFIVGTLAHLFSNQEDAESEKDTPQSVNVSPSTESPTKEPKQLPLEVQDDEAQAFAKRNQKILAGVRHSA